MEHRLQQCLGLMDHTPHSRKSQKPSQVPLTQGRESISILPSGWSSHSPRSEPSEPPGAAPSPSQLWGGEQNSHSWELSRMVSPPFPFPHCPHLSWASLSPWKIQFLPQNTQTHPLCPQDHPVPSLAPRSGDLGSAGGTAGLDGLREFFQPQHSMIPHYSTLYGHS